MTGGFHLTSAWEIAPGRSTINIPYYVDPNATTGAYSLKLTTPSGSWTSSFKVVLYTEVTIVGWVSGAFTLPTGENMGLANDLNTPYDIEAWQITANSTPPLLISNVPTFVAAGNYRMVNDHGNPNGNFSVVGITPNPCGSYVVPGFTTG